jgi:hypothetical protein
MMAAADVDLVEELHSIGRQLAILKRMYQSYSLIIDRILEKQKSVETSIEHRPSGIDRDDGYPLTIVSLAGDVIADQRRYDDSTAPKTLGVPLSSAVVTRFQRLRDRINLYPLSEIQDCLDEKESLVFMVCLS